MEINWEEERQAAEWSGEIVEVDLTDEERVTLLAAAEIMGKLETIRPWKPMFDSCDNYYVSADEIAKRFRVLAQRKPVIIEAKPSVRELV